MSLLYHLFFVYLSIYEQSPEFHSPIELPPAAQSEIDDILAKCWKCKHSDKHNFIIRAISLGAKASADMLCDAVFTDKLDILRLSAANVGNNINMVHDTDITSDIPFDIGVSTPLNIAIDKNKMWTVKILVEECGADVNYDGKSGGESDGYGCDPFNHPLAIAAYNVYTNAGILRAEYYAILKYLLSKGSLAEFNPNWNFCKGMYSISQTQFNDLIERAKLEIVAEAAVSKVEDILPPLAETASSSEAADSEDYAASGAAGGHDERSIEPMGDSVESDSDIA